jgi:cobalt-zinc-cadmium efflux system membrane fusion protein
MKGIAQATATLFLTAGSLLSVLLSGCNRVATARDPEIEEPPPVEVEHVAADGVVRPEHPERFELATAIAHSSAPELKVTGVVTADVSRNVPVISIASGRILEIHARLGDTVAKGQLLMRVQSADIAAAFSNYRQAVADEVLAQAQLDRSKILFDKGAIAQKDLEIAQDAEEKADVAVDTAIEQLRVLGADKDHPTAIVDIRAPASGVITDQQVTSASGTQGLASPNAFTISDPSHVWVLCDVYENDLSFVRVGEYAEIRLHAYPNIALTGRIGNIGLILDPNIRTAKVRIELENSGLMRFGMFVQATFHGQRQEVHAAVPCSAVLHLHDRDWVYVLQRDKTFRRVEVRCGRMIDAARQEVLSGIRPGDRVAVNSLALQNATGY